MPQNRAGGQASQGPSNVLPSDYRSFAIEPRFLSFDAVRHKNG